MQRSKQEFMQVYKTLFLQKGRGHLLEQEASLGLIYLVKVLQY